jgi:ribosomal protein L37AE/L43A
MLNLKAVSLAKPEKEECPKCGSKNFALAKDASGKHYCQKCQNIWVPGLVGLTRTDVQLKNALQENVDLKAALNKSRAELRDVTDELAEMKLKYEPPQDDTRPSAEGDIFS